MGHLGNHFDVSRRGFKHLTPTLEALTMVTSALPEIGLESEEIPLGSALHRVLGEDIFSPIDVPGVDRAAMDGYAVRADDTYGASYGSPIVLKARRETGGDATVGLGRGEAFPVVTGGRMPDGADAVVMIEYAKQAGNEIVEISTEVHPAENVSRTGEDIRKGALVLKRGERLLPQDLGMLTSLGFRNVHVKRKLKIAVLSTGNEIDNSAHPRSGKIPDVNRPVLLSAIHEIDCEPVDLGIAVDELAAIQSKLRVAIAIADIILVTAGTSVGPRDFVPQAINGLGKPGLLVHGVAMRPSMPTGLGVINGKPIVSLPGYPVSAYLAFLEFIPPIANHLLGIKPLPKPKINAKLARRVAGVLGSRTYIRVRVIEHEGTTYAEPVSVSGAGILSTLVRANGFLIVPENVEGYEEGETVSVELFRPVESNNVAA